MRRKDKGGNCRIGPVVRVGGLRVLGCVVLTVAGLVLTAAGGTGTPLVRNASFDVIDGDKAADWAFSGGLIRAARGVGHNGSCGLVWESPGASSVQAGARQTLSVEKGECYRFGALVRSENFKSADRGFARICIEWFDAGGKWIAGAYSPPLREANADWRLLEGITCAIPPEAARVTLQFFVSRNSSGSVFFDNVTVSPLSRSPVGSVFSSAYRNTAASGPVRFHAVLFPPRDRKSPDLSVTFAYRDAAGCARRVRPSRLAPDGATLSLDVSELAKGSQRIVCTLADASGRTLGEASCDFTRVDALPARRVWIDGHNRCIVDGKPFFPLGMYDGRLTETSISRLTEGPFNCVMPYGRTSREILDLCQAHGLYCFADLHQVNPGSSWARERGMTTPEQVLAYCRREIAAIRDHPALFAWYVNDEASATLVPFLRAKYELICAEDDQHPTWAVLDRAYDLGDFLPTFDVLGLDPYPVAQKPLARVTEMVRDARDCTKADRPLWGVPQTFDWSWYRKDQADRERFPTESEIRSIVWQHIAGGANGLVSYALHNLMRYATPEEFEDYWGRVVRPADEVRRLVPVLLSVEPAPAVTGAPDDLSVRAWGKDGSLYVLACNIRKEQLRARLGISSGRWRIAAAEVGEPQAKAFPGALSVDLPAHGVTLLRLSPVVPRLVWPRGRTARQIGAAVGPM